MTQAAIAALLETTQSNVSFYEKGQTVPPAVAGKLIELARDRGLMISYDHVYGAVGLPGEPAAPAETAQAKPRAPTPPQPADAPAASNMSRERDIYRERNDEAARRLERVTRGERRER